MDFTKDIPSSSGNDIKPPGSIYSFDATAPEPEWSPLPPGTYFARVVKGDYCSTRAGDDAYRIKFEVTDGEQKGKPLSRIWTFRPKAIGYTKRDLAVFGLTSTEKLLSPFPEGGREYHVRLVVALQRGDDGRGFNDIKKIDLIRVDDSPAAEFMMPGPNEGGPK